MGHIFVRSINPCPLRTNSYTCTQPVEKKKRLLINPFYKAFQTEMGGFYISSKDQYIGRYIAYLSTAQSEVFILDSTTLLLAYFKTKLISMERMIIFCMLFFCSSMALTAAPHKIAKYKQLLKTIDRLERIVKDKVSKVFVIILKLFSSITYCLEYIL